MSLRNATFLLALSFNCVLGCAKPAAPPAPAKADTGHEHAEEGPHKGHLIELGQKGEYHAELTHDDASKTITIYLLGPDAKTAVTIADPELLLNLVAAGEPQQAKLTASPQEGETGGSSRFVLVDEKVLELLEAPKTTGRLNVTINGTSYSGNLEHHDH
ncbi:hypothetical protein ETAA8_20150 [Anatilimnocola aggregata]|uniref:Uncharacterized protein n=1 Tax=Anatilimnocola aggregata TaxID=2528021 RepID=A0A517Y9R2_9BACT|nr:hypothetical protein [Anatilimnocola aggregata]QDU26931.1 hypothetical protein ETAA8_20150 [Anatilimnocola aggregata]